MAASFPLRILTPARTLFQGDVEHVQAPGSEGSFGVLARHAPLVAALGTGRLSFDDRSGQRQLATSGGFVEVAADGVTVLAETAEFAQEIDVPRAQAARDRARERLRQRDSIDVSRAQAALARALTRLRVAAGA